MEVRDHEDALRAQEEGEVPRRLHDRPHLQAIQRCLQSREDKIRLRKKECNRCGSLYPRGTIRWGVEAEQAPPHRFAVAGAVLLAGLVVGMFLAATFRWQPYFWEWLAYHNGLVAAVLIYLLLSEKVEPSRRAVPPDLVLPAVRATRVLHLTRAAVEAASSSASVFVHSLPTIQALQGTDGRLTGPIPHKAAHPTRPGGGGLEGASPGDPGPPQDRKAEIA